MLKTAFLQLSAVMAVMAVMTEKGFLHSRAILVHSCNRLGQAQVEGVRHEPS